MKSYSLRKSRQPSDFFSPEERIDKQSFLPAYAQLARILRQRISTEEYTPGTRLPSEAAMAKSFGVSAMTARQAVKVLADEGLVERIQGSGTFVKRIDVAASHFGLEPLRNVLVDRGNLEVRILKARTEKVGGKAQEALQLAPGDPVVVVERLILHHGQPFTLQVGFARFDPETPTVENMLDTEVLTGLFLEDGRSSFMKGELRLVPTTLGETEAEMLGGNPGDHAFKLEHVFYDFSDRPTAFGWFIVSPDKMPLIAKVGVWNG